MEQFDLKLSENSPFLRMNFRDSKLPAHAKAMGWALNLNKREQ